MLKLVGWEPLPSLSTLRARAALHEAPQQQVKSTATMEPSTSAENSSLLDQPLHNIHPAGLTNVVHHEAALSSPPPQLSSLTHQVPLTSPHHAAEPPQTSGDQSDHASQQPSEPGQTVPLEDGELPDGEPDDPAEAVLASQQPASEGAASVPAASTAKRKRGERAGKRVRQRQAKRLRNIELRLLLPDGTGPAAQAHKKLVSSMPTCKYFLFGKCSKGEQCPFPHTGIPVTRYICCRFYQEGQCTKGEECPYSHDNKKEPCKQLVLYGDCRFGPGCRFSHDPLPQHAVAPLQHWFAEQDQLKQDRADRCTQEQDVHNALHLYQQQQHCYYQPAAMVEDFYCMSDGEGELRVSQEDSIPAASHGADGTSLAKLGCVQGCYRHWTDGWQRLFAGRLQLMRKRRRDASPLADPSTFAPLSGPYTNWNDGWKKLFTQNVSPTQDHPRQA